MEIPVPLVKLCPLFTSYIPAIVPLESCNSVSKFLLKPNIMENAAAASTLKKKCLLQARRIQLEHCCLKCALEKCLWLLAVIPLGETSNCDLGSKYFNMRNRLGSKGKGLLESKVQVQNSFRVKSA